MKSSLKETLQLSFLKHSILNKHKWESQLIPIFFALALFLSCKRVNDDFFVQDSNINSYQFSSYTGDQEFKLDQEYQINSSEITSFELVSQSLEGTIEKIQAAYIGNIGQINSDTVLLICEEGMHHMDYYFPRVEALYHDLSNRKFGILIIDYKGSGLSTGTFSIQEMTNDLQAAIKWLQDRNLESDRFAIYAHGLGAAPCYRVINNNSLLDSLLHPSKIILENPVASSETLISNSAQFNLPPSYLTTANFDNVALAEQTTQDLLLLISENNNQFKPEQNGEIIFDNHGSQLKQKVIAENADHKELIPVLKPFHFQELVLYFIRN